MTVYDRVAGAALGVAATAGLVWTANVPITVHGSDHALLRLAWSARPERIEQCRQQTTEELARLPAHMRQGVVCEGVTAQYRLTVRHEGQIVAERVVRGGGWRHDRRLYVFEELPLEPGIRSVEVRFDRLDGERPPASESADAVPPHLVFDERIRIGRREVILVTYSPERRALVGIRDTGQAP